MSTLKHETHSPLGLLRKVFCTAHCPCACLLQFAGELRVCAGAGCAWEPSTKGGVQHLVEVSSSDKVKVGSDVGWKLLEVLLVVFREDDALHSCPVGRQDLVLDPAHLRRTDQSSLLKLWTGLHFIMC